MHRGYGGPLGRAQSRALDGVTDADQYRDLNLVVDGVKIELPSVTSPMRSGGQ